MPFQRLPDNQKRLRFAQMAAIEYVVKLVWGTGRKMCEWLLMWFRHTYWPISIIYGILERYWIPLCISVNISFFICFSSKYRYHWHEYRLDLSISIIDFPARAIACWWNFSFEQNTAKQNTIEYRKKRKELRKMCLFIYVIRTRIP